MCSDDVIAACGAFHRFLKGLAEKKNRDKRGEPWVWQNIQTERNWVIFVSDLYVVLVMDQRLVFCHYDFYCCCRFPSQPGEEPTAPTSSFQPDRAKERESSAKQKHARTLPTNCSDVCSSVVATITSSITHMLNGMLALQIFEAVRKWEWIRR